MDHLTLIFFILSKITNIHAPPTPLSKGRGNLTEGHGNVVLQFRNKNKHNINATNTINHQTISKLTVTPHVIPL